MPATKIIPNDERIVGLARQALLANPHGLTLPGLRAEIKKRNPSVWLATDSLQRVLFMTPGFQFVCVDGPLQKTFVWALARQAQITVSLKELKAKLADAQEANQTTVNLGDNYQVEVATIEASPNGANP